MSTEISSLNRRQVLTRAAIGTAATGVAWAAPRVNGLSLRPDYARAQTGPPGDSPGTSFVRDIPFIDGPCSSDVDFGGSIDLGAFGTVDYTGRVLTSCSSDYDADVTLGLPPGCSIISASFDPPGSFSDFNANTVHYSNSDSSPGPVAHLTIFCT